MFLHAMDGHKLLNFIKFGILLSLLTPLVKDVDFYFPYVGLKSLYFMAVAQIVFFSWLILAWKWKQYRPNFRNPLLLASLVFLAVFFIAAVFGADFSASFWSKFERMGGVLMMVHLTAFMVAAASVMERRDWIRLFTASVAIAFFIAAQAPFDKSTGANEGGLIGNNSFWGTYLLFNFFIAIYLFLSPEAKQRKRLKYFAAIAVLTMAASLALVGTEHVTSMLSPGKAITMDWATDIISTGARAAKLSVLGGLILFGFLWFSFAKNRPLRSLSRVLLIIGFVAGLAAFIMALQPGNPVYRFAVEKFQEGSVHGRLVVWEIGWKGFLERPYLGWGPENFNLVFARHYNPCIGSLECTGETWFDRAHNIVVDTLVETGIAGLAAYLAIFGAALFLLWKPVIRSGSQGLAEASVFTAMFAAYFIQNLTVFDMVLSFMMFYIVLAFISSDRYPVAAESRMPPLPAMPQGLIVAAAGLVCFFGFVVGPFWTDYNTVAAARAPYGTNEKLDLYDKALGVSPMGKYQIRMFFTNQWLAGLQDEEVFETVTVEGMQKTFTYLAAELEKSRAASPLDFQTRIRLGQLYNSWGFFDPGKLALAEEVLNEAHALSPQNYQYYLELAQTRVEQGKKQEAYDLVKQAHEIYPNNPKTKAALQKMETMMANDRAEEAVQGVPN